MQMQQMTEIYVIVYTFRKENVLYLNVAAIFAAVLFNCG